MKNFISNSESSTAEFAFSLAKKIKKGTTILLFGDMGAGKTTFTKSLLKALGVKSVVTSPTFTIVNQYKSGNKNINHFDMYRIEDESEADEIGLKEMLCDLNAINIVEWPQNVKSILPPNSKKITINIVGEKNREFVLDCFDD